MENKSLKDQLRYDFNKLEIASIAKEYLNQPEGVGMPYAKKSLEIMLKDMDQSDPGILKTITDSKVISQTIKNQEDIYKEVYANETVGEILGYTKNKKNLEKYLTKENLPIAEKELAGFSDRKYVDIQSETFEASNRIKEYEAKNGELNGKKESDIPEEIKKHLKTIEKYANLIQTITMLNQSRKTALRTRVQDAYNTETLNKMYKPKESSKE